MFVVLVAEVCLVELEGKEPSSPPAGLIASSSSLSLHFLVQLTEVSVESWVAHLSHMVGSAQGLLVVLGFFNFFCLILEIYV